MVHDLFKLQRQLVKPNAAELGARNRESGLLSTVGFYAEDPDIRSLTAPTAWINLAELRLKVFDGAQIIHMDGSGIAVRGDADVTLTARDAEWQFFPTLTANRTVFLPSMADKNQPFYIVRDAVTPGAFTLNVGGIKTIPANTRARVEVRFDGSIFRQTDYATL